MAIKHHLRKNALHSQYIQEKILQQSFCGFDQLSSL